MSNGSIFNPFYRHIIMAKNPLHCSFCGRNRDEVKILIAGQEGHICENCVEHAREIIDQELTVKDEKGNSSFKLTVRKPMEITKFLDDYAIGQTDAKKVLAVAVRRCCPLGPNRRRGVRTV